MSSSKVHKRLDSHAAHANFDASLMQNLTQNFRAVPPLFAGANWVDPPKRERKRLVNYAENEFYRQAMAKREYGPRASGPRLPKMPQLQVGVGVGLGNGLHDAC